MNASVRHQLARRKRRILRRLEHRPGVERPEPMMTAANIHYEIADDLLPEDWSSRYESHSRP